MLPLNPAFEHAILVMSGDCALDGQPLEQRMLYYLGTARAEAGFSSRDGGRVLLIGGPPFPERILMWWNFVARTPDEITQARADWEEQRRFGEVKAYAGPRLERTNADAICASESRQLRARQSPVAERNHQDESKPAPNATPPRRDVATKSGQSMGQSIRLMLTIELLFAL